MSDANSEDRSPENKLSSSVPPTDDKPGIGVLNALSFPNQSAGPGITTNIGQPRLQVVAAGLAKFTGPIPPPDILRGYGEIDPSLPGRIMAMAEGASKTEQVTRKRALNFAFADEMAARLIAFAFALAALGVSYKLAMASHEKTAIAIGVGTMAAVVATLIRGSSASGDGPRTDDKPTAGRDVGTEEP